MGCGNSKIKTMKHQSTVAAKVPMRKIFATLASTDDTEIARACQSLGKHSMNVAMHAQFERVAPELLEALLRALRVASTTYVAECCAEAVWTVLPLPGYLEAFVEVGAVEKIVGLLHRLIDSVSCTGLLSHTLCALSSALDDADFTPPFLSAGGIDTCLRALRKHIGNYDAVLFLTTIFAGMYSSTASHAFLTAGGLPILAQLMELHSDRADVTQNACTILWALADHEYQATAAVALPCLLKALKRLGGRSEEVVISAIGALYSFSQKGVTCTAAVHELGGEAVLSACLPQAKYTAKVHASFKSILFDLTQPIKPEMRRAGALIRAVEGLISDSDVIYARAVEALGLCDVRIADKEAQLALSKRPVDVARKMLGSMRYFLPLGASAPAPPSTPTTAAHLLSSAFAAPIAAATSSLPKNVKSLLPTKTTPSTSPSSNSATKSSTRAVSKSTKALWEEYDNGASLQQDETRFCAVLKIARSLLTNASILDACLSLGIVDILLSHITVFEKQPAVVTICYEMLSFIQSASLDGHEALVTSGILDVVTEALEKGVMASTAIPEALDVLSSLRNSKRFMARLFEFKYFARIVHLIPRHPVDDDVISATCDLLKVIMEHKSALSLSDAEHVNLMLTSLLGPAFKNISDDKYPSYLSIIDILRVLAEGGCYAASPMRQLGGSETFVDKISKVMDGLKEREKEASSGSSAAAPSRALVARRGSKKRAYTSIASGTHIAWSNDSSADIPRLYESISIIYSLESGSPLSAIGATSEGGKATFGDAKKSVFAKGYEVSVLIDSLMSQIKPAETDPEVLFSSCLQKMLEGSADCVLESLGEVYSKYALRGGEGEAQSAYADSGLAAPEADAAYPLLFVRLRGTFANNISAAALRFVGVEAIVVSALRAANVVTSKYSPCIVPFCTPSFTSFLLALLEDNGSSAEVQREAIVLLRTLACCSGDDHDYAAPDAHPLPPSAVSVLSEISTLGGITVISELLSRHGERALFAENCTAILAVLSAENKMVAALAALSCLDTLIDLLVKYVRRGSTPVTEGILASLAALARHRMDGSSAIHRCGGLGTLIAAIRGLWDGKAHRAFVENASQVLECLESGEAFVLPVRSLLSAPSSRQFSSNNIAALKRSSSQTAKGRKRSDAQGSSASSPGVSPFSPIASLIAGYLKMTPHALPPSRGGSGQQSLAEEGSIVQLPSPTIAPPSFFSFLDRERLLMTINDTLQNYFASIPLAVATPHFLGALLTSLADPIDCANEDFIYQVCACLHTLCEHSSHGPVAVTGRGGIPSLLNFLNNPSRRLASKAAIAAALEGIFIANPSSACETILANFSGLLSAMFLLVSVPSEDEGSSDASKAFAALCFVASSVLQVFPAETLEAFVAYPRSITALVRAMAKYSSSTMVMTSAGMFLAAGTTSAAGCREVLDAGGILVLSNSLARFAEEPNLAVDLLSIFRNVCVASSCRDLLPLDSSIDIAVRNIVAAAQLYADVWSLVAITCVSLCSLSSTPAGAQVIVQGGGVPFLMRVICAEESTQVGVNDGGRGFQESKERDRQARVPVDPTDQSSDVIDATAQACAALVNVALIPEGSAAVTRAGGPRALVQLLSVWRGNATLTASVAQILLALTGKEVAAALIVKEKGGMETLYQVLEAFKTSKLSSPVFDITCKIFANMALYPSTKAAVDGPRVVKLMSS